MKLGLAEMHPPGPPVVLVMGEGAVTDRICLGLRSLGLETQLISELPLSATEREIPKLTDFDAAPRFKKILSAFQLQSELHAWIHPGVTLWGERPELEGWARQCGVSTIAPPAKALNAFWNVLHLLKEAESLGVPTLLMNDDPLTSVREIEDAIGRLVVQRKATLPFVLKSAFRMRGGLGQRVIKHADDLKEWVPVWMNHLKDQTGSSVLFLERYLESARSYFQPFVRFKDGHTEFFPVVDGSLMNDGRNWIEVCPAQGLDEKTHQQIKEHTQKILNHVDFVGMGMFIFLSNGAKVYLTEALSRINLGFHLWEKIAKTNAIHWQVAALAPALSRTRPVLKLAETLTDREACGINLKIFAEDTYLKIPHPGEIHEMSDEQRWTEGNSEGFLDWDVKPGQKIDYRSSGSLGQVTVFSQGWVETLKATKHFLSQIWISGGVQTNERFLFELISHPWVEASMFYTGFVDEEFVPKHQPEPRWLSWIRSILNEMMPPLLQGEKDAESWIWLNQRLIENKEAYPFQWHSKMEFITATGMKGIKGFIQEGLKTERVCVYPVSPQRVIVRIRNWFFSVRRSQKGRPLQIMALASGRVHSVFYQEGAVVEAKSTVLMIESLQSFISHKLPVKVKIKKIKVRAEDEVLVGQELAEIEKVD